MHIFLISRVLLRFKKKKKKNNNNKKPNLLLVKIWLLWRPGVSPEKYLPVEKWSTWKLSIVVIDSDSIWVFAGRTGRMKKAQVLSYLLSAQRRHWSDCPAAWRKLRFLATYWAHSEDWSDWADARADLSLRWTHSHFVGFAMRRLIFCFLVLLVPLKGYMSHLKTKPTK